MSFWKLNFEQSPHIEFTTHDYGARINSPIVPASEMLPDAWTNLQGVYHLQNQEMKTARICPALGEWMDMGYILRAHCDIEVQLLDNMPAVNHVPCRVVYSDPKYNTEGFGPIQIGKLLPDYEFRGVVKLQHPWWVKTAPGYSCLLIPLLYWNQPFHAVPGVLDTDICHMDFPINIMVKKKKDFVIKLGDPLVQIIPFKKESIVGVSRETNDGDRTRNKKLLSQLFSRFTGISKFFSKPGSYSLDRKDLDLD